MRFFTTGSILPLIALGLLTTTASISNAATITGTVTGPDGAAFRGAFVQARNAATKITVSVLSDNQGHYEVPRLDAGDYHVSIRAPGYRSDPKSGVKLTADQNASYDFALQKGAVRWADLSFYQGFKLLPEDRGKAEWFQHCFACHGFESRMASVKRDEDGWRDRVNYMREAMGFFINRPQNGFTDQTADDIVYYLNRMFGEESVLPKSPTDLPEYKDTVHRFSDEALKIVYVEYEMPGPNRMPWSAYPDKDGRFWIPYYGRANRIGRLNPATGVIDEFPVPETGTAAIHSAVPAPDGSVWLTEQGSNKLGRWDPATQKITEFQDDWGKHTIRVDAKGEVWSTGGLTRFDPKYQTFTHITDVPSSYGIALDKDGNVWFAELRRDGRIGKVDAKTLQVTKYQPPTATGFPRRIQVDSDGVVWFAEFQAGKIGQFDPRTERFKEFALPGEKPTPYALGIDADHKVWYSSEWMDVIGRLDTATGQVVEFPIPHAENTMREFTTDAEGRFWYGSPANDRVGYFYLAK
jgi:virginiamycin B lyase